MTGAVVLLTASPLLGVSIRPSEASEVPQIAEAGFRAVRTDLFWHEVEREKGRYDFSSYDALMESLRRFSLTPVLILDYANPHYDGGDAPRTPEGRAAFARFAAAAAARYAGRGVIWEIWNEPNVPGLWTPVPSPEDYVRLVEATYPALKAADPTGVVAGLSLGGCVWDREFLGRSFALGLLNHVDAVAIHSYPAPSPEEAAAFYEELRGLIRSNAPGRNLPIFCTELGILTHDEAKHRDHLVRMVTANVRSGLPLTIWYSWRDDEEGHYGFLDASGRKKLAYFAVPALAQLAASAAGEGPPAPAAASCGPSPSPSPWP